MDFLIGKLYNVPFSRRYKNDNVCFEKRTANERIRNNIKRHENSSRAE